MSLHPEPIGPIPEETVRVAGAAFPHGTRWMRLRDRLGVIYDDALFAPLFSRRGQPAAAPWRLALVSVLQFAEGLSDRQAADAVRSRIDRKYLLGLELTDPGFDASVLSEFRARVVAGGAEEQLLERLLDLCRQHGWLAAGGRQRTDSTHVLAAVRVLNRLGCARQALRLALNTLAAVAPDWLRAWVPAAWAERYDRHNDDPWHPQPTKPTDQAAQARTIGADGLALLMRIYAADAPAWLREVSAVQTLRRVWVQHFVTDAGALRLRTREDGWPAPMHAVCSPHDLDAHYATKPPTTWLGYKVHLTETCEEAAPHLITHVATSEPAAFDGSVTPRIHAGLQRRELLPGQHLVDTAYADADLLVGSQRDFGVDLVAPARLDRKPQARARAGYDSSQFRVDWRTPCVICPAGGRSVSWTPAVDGHGQDVIKIEFSGTTCKPCVNRATCLGPNHASYARRTLTLRPEAQYEALRSARERQTTDAFAELYGLRSGIEGTISQAARACRIRRSRSVGRAKTHLGQVLAAIAINVQRLDDWLTGTPRSATRHSAFARLMAAAT
jgi:transposase